MGPVWSHVIRTMRNFNVENRAFKEIERPNSLNPKPAPRYPTEAEKLRHLENDMQLSEEISRKNENLDRNLQSIELRESSETVGTDSSRQLPTKALEMAARGEPEPAFRFWEPPKETIPRNKLMFREVVELLNAKLTDNPGNDGKSFPEIPNSLSEHDAVKRVDREKIRRVFAFFSPFERQGHQIMSKSVYYSDLPSSPPELTEPIEEYLEKVSRVKRAHIISQQTSQIRKSRAEADEVMKELKLKRLFKPESKQIESDENKEDSDVQTKNDKT